MKKKKTIHLRRLRKRSENKIKKIPLIKLKEGFFKLLRIKNNMLYTFILSNYGVSFNIIDNYLKKFGLPKTYRLKKFKKVKKKSYKLLFKFNVNTSFSKKKTRDFHKLINFLKKKIKALLDKRVDRAEVIKFKKLLCLHFSYRHILQLPIRGQRTKTNARTRKNFNII